MNDPLGKAIEVYQQKPSKKLEIIVHSKVCDDDVIPVHYLFRTYKDFPKIEKIAIDHCQGKTLDVGAGAGAHTLYLKQKGIDIHAIDISERAIRYIQSLGIPARKLNFFDLQAESYDTILMLMNGIGIAGELANLEQTLLKCYQLLNDNGQVLLDSSDIIYLFTEEDGSIWMDLNAHYYGDFDYQMEFDGEKTDWFKWLFVDFEKLKNIAEKIGFHVELLHEEDTSYLARLIKK